MANSELNPDVLAQMHRLHSALNDGTVDVATANDALRLLHDFLTGAAYETPSHPPPLAHGDVNDIVRDGGEADEGGEDEHPAKRRGRHKR